MIVLPKSFPKKRRRPLVREIIGSLRIVNELDRASSSSFCHQYEHCCVPTTKLASFFLQVDLYGGRKRRIWRRLELPPGWPTATSFTKPLHLSRLLLPSNDSLKDYRSHTTRPSHVIKFNGGHVGAR